MFVRLCEKIEVLFFREKAATALSFTETRREIVREDTVRANDKVAGPPHHPP